MGDIKKRTYPRVIDLLEQAVKEKGQRAVSRETRVPLLSIQRFLKGMSEPTTATLEKLAKYFDVTVAELRGERVLSGFACRDEDVIFRFDKDTPEEDIISIPMRAIIELGANVALMILRGYRPDYVPKGIIDQMQPLVKKSANGKKTSSSADYYFFGSLYGGAPAGEEPEQTSD